MYNHEQEEEALAVTQSGGASSMEEDDVDGESESELEDDLMDKISSSPSIEDGALNPRTPVAWPRRESSLTSPQPNKAATELPGSDCKETSWCSSERTLAVRETGVSACDGKPPVAEWRPWLDARQHARWQRSSERESCREDDDEDLRNQGLLQNRLCSTSVFHPWTASRACVFKD